MVKKKKTKKENTEPTGEPKWTITDALRLIRSYIVTTFRDENGDPWALYEDGNFRLQHNIETKEFEDWVRDTLEKAMGPKGTWVTEIQKTLGSQARRNNTQILSLRMKGATNPETKKFWFFYHLGTDKELVIHEKKLEITDMGPTYRILAHQGPFSIDRKAKKEDIKLLDKYLPFANNSDKELFKSLLPAYLVPNITKPGILTTGPPKAAKSSFCRVVKHIIDPGLTINKGGGFPKDLRDWFVRCQNHAIFILDNVGHLTPQQQDILCQIVTGLTHEERELYTNKGFMSTEIKGVPLINGIELTGLQSDMLDRFLLFPVERISPEKIIPEQEFWEQFSRDVPKIRYACLLLLAEAMEVYQEISPEQQFRCADFARWTEAVSKVRGISDEEHSTLFNRKIRLQHDETLAQSQLVEPLITLMNHQDEWSGTASQLLKKLNEQEYGQIVGGEDHERTIISNIPKSWYKTPESLGKELARIGPFITSEGVFITKGHSGRDRIIKISRKQPLELLAPTKIQDFVVDKNDIQFSWNIPSATCKHLLVRTPISIEELTVNGSLTVRHGETVSSFSLSESKIMLPDEMLTVYTAIPEKRGSKC